MAIRVDNPIRDPEDDVLGRVDEAKKFAQSILDNVVLDPSEGAVVGVFGPWGSGKTSFLNLARKEFEKNDIPVIDFNPWLFSGTEQLVGQFFDEISAQLSFGYRIRKALGKYADALTSVSNLPDILRTIGGVSSFTGLGTLTIGFVPNLPDILRTIGGTLFPVGLLLIITGEICKLCQGDINSRRKKVEKVLKKRNKRIIVVLDDVDRLEKSEIRNVFKLVRLTASFPNIVYIVVCDRLCVEQALGKGQRGRDYLEKIVQLQFDLPQASNHILNQQFRNEIEKTRADIKNHGPLDEQVWIDVSREIVQPLIRNMRDVRRYAAAIRGTVAGLEGKVALADVFGLEAVRMFLPDAFNRLPVLMDILTVRSPLSSTESESMSYEAAFRKYSNEPENMEIDARRIDELIEACKAPEVVKAMLHLLFPACGKNIFGANIHQQFPGKDGQDIEKIRKLLSSMDIPLPEKYLVDCRVAHEAIFRLYLERTDAEGVSVAEDTEQAFERMADQGDLGNFLESLTPQRRSEVIWHLRGFEDRFREEQVIPGIIVLLNLLPDMLENPVYPYDPQVSVKRIIAQLFPVLNNVDSVEAAVRRILPEVTMLFPKVVLVFEIGYRDTAGRRLVSQEAAIEFENELLDRIRDTPIDDLTEESDWGLVVHFANTVVDSSKDPFDSKKSAQLTFIFLRSVMKKTSDVDSIGPVQYLKRESLVDLYGSEEILKARIENLRTQFEILKPWIEETQKMTPDAAAELLDRADEFLSRTKPG